LPGILGKPVGLAWHPFEADWFYASTDDKCVSLWDLNGISNHVDKQPK
jgi:hypothetical protein